MPLSPRQIMSVSPTHPSHNVAASIICLWGLWMANNRDHAVTNVIASAMQVELVKHLVVFRVVVGR